MITQTKPTQIHKTIWFLHFPRKTYSEGVNYYGTFPEGFIKKLKSLNLEQHPIIHLCSGQSDYGDITIDINPRSRAKVIRDARHTGLDDCSAGFVLLDPYYSKEDYEKAGQKYTPIYQLLNEAYRICRPGGYIAVLHNRSLKKPSGASITHFIAISLGPHRLLRVFMIFRKDIY